MTVNRRRLLRSLAAAGGGVAAMEGQTAASPAIDALRGVATSHGLELTDERLRTVQPVLRQRQAQLQAVRDFAVDDEIEPTHGCF